MQEEYVPMNKRIHPDAKDFKIGYLTDQKFENAGVVKVPRERYCTVDRDCPVTGSMCKSCTNFKINVFDEIFADSNLTLIDFKR